MYNIKQINHYTLAGVNDWLRFSLLTSTRIVQWWYALLWPNLAAVPDTLQSPTTMSSLLLISARTFQRSCKTWQRNSKLDLLWYLLLLVKKVQFKLPVSWYTVPPPLFLRANWIKCWFKCLRFTSVQGFWCRPITTQGRLDHRNNKEVSLKSKC